MRGELESSRGEACQTLLEAPFVDERNEYGLWISWNGKQATFRFEKDRNLAELHPYIHTPSQTTNTQLLKGGGSGATVFSGDLLGQELVWKHGDEKDLGEVFALASVEHELLHRSQTAAKELRSRIPKFRGVYISPNHIRVRSQEVWKVVEKSVRRWSLVPMEGDDSMHNSLHGQSESNARVTSPSRMQRRFSVCSGDSCCVEAQESNIRVFLRRHEMGERGEIVCDYETLKELVDNLRVLQKKHFWKVSIAQSKIGGPNPKNAAALHVSGQLGAAALDKLVEQFIVVVRALQDLAKENERHAADHVRREIELMDKTTTAADVSTLANSFVGMAIHKNFDLEKGRLKLIRETCLSLLSDSLILRPEEELPAKVLYKAYEVSRNTIAPFFGAEKDLDMSVVVYEQPRTWRNLLSEACSLKSPAATQRIWTCGLTDAGLHNMFFSQDRLWLFDLGEPTLQPIPAFLTKPLMSFFHTLGMEETLDGKSWVNRFEPRPDDGDTVQLTARTKELLPAAYASFDTFVDRLVTEIFDSEEDVRWLLTKYVILQLISDAAFCLERWQRKGGGSLSYDNHQMGLEKWLWRALWDMFVCNDVSRHYGQMAVWATQ